MNLDIAEHHIRSVVRECLQEQVADQQLADPSWLDAKTNGYIAAVGDTSDEDMESVSLEFTTALKEELKARHPRAYQED